METLCSLFGKKRQWYYANQEKVISNRQRIKIIADQIMIYRISCPRIGGPKLYELLKMSVGKDITHGRDSFLKVYSDLGFKLLPNKKIHTTNSNHIFVKYPNRIIGVEAAYPNHIWVSDITYVWISGDVLYLHLVTDAYSHCVIGWHLSESLEAKNTIKALLMAIQTAGGGNLCGTIHHSDRGSQYACNEYVECLKLHHIQISMTERYNPTDNPIAERQNGILKTEWIYQQEIYANYETALYEIGNAIDAYNNIRPHMSIGYKRPMEVYLGSEPGPNLWKKNKKV